MPETTYYRNLDPAWCIESAIARACLGGLGWRLQIDGPENLPKSGPAVIVLNHHSALDSLMAAWAPAVELGRRVRFLTAADPEGHGPVELAERVRAAAWEEGR